MRILVVEDEVALYNTIAKGLRLDGYEVDTCFDGVSAWDTASLEKYDLIILDLNLPKMDGMDVLRNIRKDDGETAILVLSARVQLQDKIDGLDNGANDYLCKPFHFAELEARGEPLNLTRKELGILEYLLLHQERPIPSQEELIRHVWDANVDSFSNSIRVHISALRKKLRNTLGYDPITNRITQGYMIGGKKMNRSRSLQWRLTIITAFIVTLSSLAMRYAISKAAIHSMGEIEDSAISIFPSTDADDDFSGEMLAIELNPRELLSDSIKKKT
ncbi:MAG: response regulator transcription factor [Erysipelotrichaceae bacterium]|nr:response regulator transcription factor [Erysipelotrichaceae bacterium]MDY6034166.1 response regulator transcription factor [Bulleidia sp.]